MLDIKGCLFFDEDIPDMHERRHGAFAIDYYLKNGKLPTYLELVAFRHETYVSSLAFGPTIRLLKPFDMVLSRMPVANRFLLWDEAVGSVVKSRISPYSGLWGERQLLMELEEGTYLGMFGIPGKEAMAASVFAGELKYITYGKIDLGAMKTWDSAISQDLGELFDGRSPAVAQFNINIGLLGRIVDIIDGKSSGATTAHVLDEKQQGAIDNFILRQDRGKIFSYKGVDSAVARIEGMTSRGLTPMERDHVEGCSTSSRPPTTCPPMRL